MAMAEDRLRLSAEERRLLEHVLRQCSPDVRREMVMWLEDMGWNYHADAGVLDERPVRSIAVEEWRADD